MSNIIPNAINSDVYSPMLCLCSYIPEIIVISFTKTFDIRMVTVNNTE